LNILGWFEFVIYCIFILKSILTCFAWSKWLEVLEWKSKLRNEKPYDFHIFEFKFVAWYVCVDLDVECCKLEAIWSLLSWKLLGFIFVKAYNILVLIESLWQ